MLFIGASDLSYSLGVGGQASHPKLQEAIARVVAAAQRHHVPVGRPAATAESMQQFMNDGFLFFQAPSDLVMMANGARSILQPLGKSGFDPKTQPMY